ncbi:MAG: diaminopimelate epimerase [Acidobacteriia bacterium]|nr:diaminopimelate epimerase [Terriglobia bacterium]
MIAGMRIVKMSGAGNDFVVIGAREAEALGDGLASWARRVCRRGLSVGADGVLVVTPSSAGRIRVVFVNPDGVPAFCGNGCRCAARFAVLESLVHETLVLETSVGDVPARILGDRVRLVLPPPRAGRTLELDVSGTIVGGREVLSGVPHFVVPVVDVACAPLEAWGPALRLHPQFGTEGTNVDVMGRRHDGIAVRTWERGVEGETLACGSGAVAAAHAARLLGWTGDSVRVSPRSGIPLLVELPGPKDAPEAAILEGDARVVFEGTLAHEATLGFEG